MVRNRLAKILFASFIVCSLITTSLGGAFATTALAATPEEEAQQVSEGSSGTAVLGGLVAIGLISMLANRDESSGSASALDKNATPASAQQPVKQPAAPVTQQKVPSTTGQTTQSTSTVTTSGLTADEAQAVTLMNADRAANGLPALKVNLKLTGLARNYAQDMINRNFFSHYDPEGRSPFDRMQQYGISYRYAGENLAINSSVAAAERAFMNSPGHRANILNPNYTQIGLGVRYSQSGSVYVVQEFIDG